MIVTQASKLFIATKIQTFTDINQDVHPESYHLWNIKNNRNMKKSM